MLRLEFVGRKKSENLAELKELETFYLMPERWSLLTLLHCDQDTGAITTRARAQKNASRTLHAGLFVAEARRWEGVHSEEDGEVPGF